MAYTRVSSPDQSAGRQLDGIVVDRTFADAGSGKDPQRPQLAALAREFGISRETVYQYLRSTS